MKNGIPLTALWKLDRWCTLLATVAVVGAAIALGATLQATLKLNSHLKCVE